MSDRVLAARRQKVCESAARTVASFDFDLQVQRETSRTRITVRGELDLGTTAELDRALEEAREAGRPIVLDLRDLSFMDSTGVRQLLMAAQQAQGEPPPLTMVGPRGGDAALTLVETGISALLPLVDEEDVP